MDYILTQSVIVAKHVPLLSTKKQFLKIFDVVQEFHNKCKNVKKLFIELEFAFSSLSILKSIFILAIVSHPHFLMGSCHLSSTVLQNQTIIFAFSVNYKQ